MIPTKERQKDELGNISVDMRKLYDEALSGKLKREEVDSLANVAGKNLKALQMLWAHDVSAFALMQFNAKLNLLQEKQLPLSRSEKKK